MRGQQRPSNDPRHIQHSPNTPTTGLRERANDTSKSTGRSGRQNAATRRNMRREERVTVQGPVKEQPPNGMPHRGWVPPPSNASLGEGGVSVEGGGVSAQGPGEGRGCGVRGGLDLP